MITRHKIAATLAAAAVVLGVGGGIAAVQSVSSAAPQAPAVQSPQSGPAVDLPEPGDVPDTPGH
ncbi:MAG TPA: hypothetical protein VH166_13150 [Mycobacterium sp.]|jgi:hypothetical protein|nr:hypothetical protein [Mycobacterium sp.]